MSPLLCTSLICINKYDLNEDNTYKIENYFHKQGVGVVSKIPFDNVVTEAVVKGIPVVECGNNDISRQIEQLWAHISTKLEESCVISP